MPYAEKTKVPVDRSKAEIERILTRYGADQFMYGMKEGMAMVAFRASERYVRFILPLPDEDPQEVRRRWRCLVLVIKSKLESVNSGILTFDQEFMANIVLPDGGTVSDFMVPQIEEAYATQKMPRMLPYIE